MAARRQENDLKRKGLDPHLAYDPTSEYFIGKPANIQKWAGSLTGDLKAKVEAAASGMPKPDAPKPPEKGLIKDGWEFLGGEPGVAANWRQVK
jgi:hypothetical protein